MTTKIQKWGNSQGIRVSKALLREVGISVGEEVEISVEEGVLVVTPVSRNRGKYRLADLIREIPDGYDPGEVSWGPPEGGEVW
jgi:antitoxin MazE